MLTTRRVSRVRQVNVCANLIKLQSTVKTRRATWLPGENSIIANVDNPTKWVNSLASTMLCNMNTAWHPPYRNTSQVRVSDHLLSYWRSKRLQDCLGLTRILLPDYLQPPFWTNRFLRRPFGLKYDQTSSRTGQTTSMRSVKERWVRYWSHRLQKQMKKSTTGGMELTWENGRNLHFDKCQTKLRRIKFYGPMICVGVSGLVPGCPCGKSILNDRPSLITIGTRPRPGGEILRTHAVYIIHIS